jgi:uncharacterized protein (TIGR02246 family)
MMSAIGHKCLCLFILALLLYAGAPGDDRAGDANRNAAHRALTSLAEAINARDSKAVSERFTPGGEFVDGGGNVFQGRDAIASEFSELFARNPKTAMELAADEIRELSPGLLTVKGAATINAKELAEPIRIEFAALLVKLNDGSWLLASVRSEGEQARRSPHARLQQLTWLLGDWVDESRESTMQTSTRWSDDGNFLLTDFTVRAGGRKALAGTQRIGWDAALEKFKSWVFDTDGGHTEGIWTQLGDRWIVKATGVRPSGEAFSATQIFEPAGADAYLFSSVDRIVGDQAQPDFTAHVVRRPPEPERAPKTAGK